MTLFEQGNDRVSRDILIHHHDPFFKLAAHLNCTVQGNQFNCSKVSMRRFLMDNKFPEWFPVEFFEKMMADTFDEFVFWGIWDSEDEVKYDEFVNEVLF